MPVYDYSCVVCHNTSEDRGHIEESTKNKNCYSPMCKGANRVFRRCICVTPPTIILKGGCWGKDGYSGDSNRKKNSKL
jgi:predicted nucleic acid-binding Zn ribbon protein